MKKILITIIAEDDKFETSSFMNDFILFKSSKSAKEYHIKDLYYEEKRFFELTEDERVILRNIRNADYGNYIGRGDSLRENTPINYNLYLRGNDESKAYAIGTIYNHLFQFIKILIFQD